MKFETLLLRGLFAACLTVCCLIFGAMLTASPTAVQISTASSVSAVLLAAPSQCALPQDGVVCLRDWN